jgi:hypothetical protein
MERASLLTQQTILTPHDAAFDMSFGRCVCLSGDTAVVGAQGTQKDPGAAYVFIRRGATWSQEAKLLAGDGAPGDMFGSAVSVSGDTAVIGAYGKAGFQGAAYVFTRHDGSWGKPVKLTASDGMASPPRGVGVPPAHDLIMVGASGKLHNAGAVYVFERQGAGWVERRLTAKDGAPGDFLGGALSASGNTLVAGASGKDRFTGAAYVFVRDALAWHEETKLTAGGAMNDSLGASVTVSGDIAILGAPLNGTGKGAGHLFTRTGATWEHLFKFSGALDASRFAAAVSLSGTVSLVSVSSEATGTGGVQLHRRSSNGWVLAPRFAPSDSGPYDHFGLAVSVSGDTALVGAPGKDGKGACYVYLIA